MFVLLYEFFGHGQASSHMTEMDDDLIDLCMASGKNEAGQVACMSKGAKIADFGKKQLYLAKVAQTLQHCPWKTCVISTPGFPIVARGTNVN